MLRSFAEMILPDSTEMRKNGRAFKTLIRYILADQMDWHGPHFVWLDLGGGCLVQVAAWFYQYV